MTQDRKAHLQGQLLQTAHGRVLLGAVCSCMAIAGTPIPMAIIHYPGVQGFV